MALEMTPLVSVVETDDIPVITDGTSSTMVQPLDTVDSKFIPEVDMAEPFYRFSNRHKKGCYLNLPMDSYNKININKQAPGKIEFTTSIVRPSFQQIRSTHHKEVQSVVESSLSSCLMQESYAMKHESSIKPGDNQPTGEQEIRSNEVAYIEDEVNSTRSNTDIVHLDETYILKKKPMQLRKKSILYGSLKTSSKATMRRTTHGKHHHHSRQSTCDLPLYTNIPFLCRYHCGSKRKAGTYSGEVDICPFARRKFFPSTVWSNLIENTSSLEYHQHLSLSMCASVVEACP